MVKSLQAAVQQITGFRVSVRDNGAVLTVSNKESSKGSFGQFKNDLSERFNISRFDGASFDVLKQVTK